MNDTLLNELTTFIDDRGKHLKQGQYRSEASVRRSIVDRILDILGWPDEPAVIPEYEIEGRRVDYALFDPPSSALVFIEAKAPGKIDEGEEQLFEYAFSEGVPIAVLTDGQRWRFFYSTGSGRPRDRQVCELNLCTGDSRNNANSLVRYLSYNLVRTGASEQAIRDAHRKIVEGRRIQERLPGVWSELLSEKNEVLLLAVMEKSTEMGIDPTETQILTFLKTLDVKQEIKPDPPKRKQVSTRRQKSTQQRREPSTLRVIIPNEEVIENQSARVVFTRVIEKMGLEDVMRVAPNYVSRSPYLNGKHFKSGQYYINTNNGTPEKRDILERIAKRLGRYQDMKVQVVPKQL